MLSIADVDCAYVRRVVLYTSRSLLSQKSAEASENLSCHFRRYHPDRGRNAMTARLSQYSPVDLCLPLRCFRTSPWPVSTPPQEFRRPPDRAANPRAERVPPRSRAIRVGVDLVRYTQRAACASDQGACRVRVERASRTCGLSRLAGRGEWHSPGWRRRVARRAYAAGEKVNTAFARQRHTSLVLVKGFPRIGRVDRDSPLAF